MLKHLLLTVVVLLPAGAMAQESEIPLLHAGTDINNIDSLSAARANFMNYCSGCHSLKYLRYNDGAGSKDDRAGTCRGI